MWSTIAVAVATGFGAWFSWQLLKKGQRQIERNSQLLRRAWANLQVDLSDNTVHIEDTNYRSTEVWEYRFDRFLDALARLEAAAPPTSRDAQLCDRLRAEIHFEVHTRDQILDTMSRLRDVFETDLDT